MVSPINPAVTPPAGEIDSVAAPTGDPLQDVVLAQFETFRTLKLSEREFQLALRERKLDAIDDAYDHAVAAVRARKNSSLLNAAISGLSVAAGSYFEVQSEKVAAGAFKAAPEVARGLDGAFGFGAQALEEDLKETEAKNDADQIETLESDASDRLQRFSELQSKAIEILGDLGKSQSSPKF